MQKYNYISEMGSNPPSYDPHRGIDLGTLPAPPPVSSHSIIDDSKMPPFSGASFQPFSLPVSTINIVFTRIIWCLNQTHIDNIFARFHFHIVTPQTPKAFI